nr:MAG TPA: hypothetical protein [Caudoviricetes sp.]
MKKYLVSWKIKIIIQLKVIKNLFHPIINTGVLLYIF